jgi:hypothetical protein
MVAMTIHLSRVCLTRLTADPRVTHPSTLGFTLTTNDGDEERKC